ncbi:serine O-acetyltransferase [Rhodovulum sp. DZ06]|uniref:serine O-acetyltransferase n=1 Tax=Rhodovulum sp. DZ06 TaxID=3425126 RepID=UPI003D33BCC0
MGERPYISATEPDWRREAPARFWDPGRRLLACIRAYAKAGTLGRKRWALSHRFWSAVTSCDIPLNARIGGGLILPHATGIVIHPEAEIGPNCLVFQNVTIGRREGAAGAPKIGGRVDIGAGAVILGDVSIGDQAIIGANAVVTRDVPPGGVAMGVPARVVRVMDAAPPAAPDA